jgi:hypothetical protein
MMDYIALCQTSSNALKFIKMLQLARIKCELRPVPRKLSISCGAAVFFTTNKDYHGLLTPDVLKVYRVVDNEYILVYPM